MITRNKTSLFMAALLAASFFTAGTALAGKPTIAGGCKKCHTGQPDAVRGKLGSVSQEFNTLQVSVGKMIWIVNYDDKTTVVKGDKTLSAEEISKLPANKEILVSFTGTPKEPKATEIAVKMPYKVPEHQKFTNAEVVKLVAMGPEKGNYALVDARPGGAYMSGHIPTAVSLPYGAFQKKHASVLPKDKDRLLIFYCGGPTWTLSPFSAREAEALGYTNVKVLSTGLPGWKKNKGLVVSESNNLKKMIHEDDSYVLIDLRSKDAATAGHIKGAVSIPEAELAAAKDEFPQKKSAPIILYSDAQASDDAFATVRGWGYKNVSVLKGGANAWDGKFFQGDPGSKIVYVKKLKPGQISVAEFKQIAAATPQDKLILDVRDAGLAGYISGALNIPQAQLADRLAEVPKDKEIIIHCNTGIMASMAIKTLKDNGYNARYLNAVVQVGSDGSLEITDK